MYHVYLRSDLYLFRIIILYTSVVVYIMSESHRLMRDPEPGQVGYPGNPGFPGFPDYTRYSGATQFEGHSFESDRPSQSEKDSTRNGSIAPDPTQELDWDEEKDPENPMNWSMWKKVIHTAIPAIYTFGLYVISDPEGFEGYAD